MSLNKVNSAGGPKELDESNKRRIVIDGNNVAFRHGKSLAYSVEGIQYCLQYFEKMGHKAKAVVQSIRREPFRSSNPGMLEQLYLEDKILFTPCRHIGRKLIVSYDDRIILQIACEWNAAVVSDNKFMNLIDESPAFKEIAETRVIGYTWCDNTFMLRKDPYGSCGPTLDEILRC